MRIRFVALSYSVGNPGQSLERHYLELREDLIRQGRQYALAQHTSHYRPPVDIHETSSDILVKIELAGVQEDQLDITLYENALVVMGRREDDFDHDSALCFHEAQVHYGPFRAEIRLPAPVRPEHVHASYVNGFLRFQMPKRESGSGPSEHKEGSGEKSTSSGSLRRLDAAGLQPALAPGVPDFAQGHIILESTPVRRII